MTSKYDQTLSNANNKNFITLTIPQVIMDIIFKKYEIFSAKIWLMIKERIWTFLTLFFFMLYQ